MILQAVLLMVAQTTEQAPAPIPVPSDWATWVLGGGAAVVLLEVRLRAFFSTVVRGVLENMRPFFKDVLKEALDERDKENH